MKTDIIIIAIFIVFAAILAWWLKVLDDNTQYKTLFKMPHQSLDNSDNFRYCTIDCGENGDFLAKVKRNAHGIGPSHVLVDGEWLPLDEFDDLPFVSAYSCRDYRFDLYIDSDDLDDF